MVRAAIIGLLMPASGDPKKDRDVFLKILTMDEDGLLQRKAKSIPLREIYARLTPAERADWFDAPMHPPMHPQMDADYTDEQSNSLRPSASSADQDRRNLLRMMELNLRDLRNLRMRKGISREQKDRIQQLVFARLSYDEKLEYCDRPEQIDGPSEAAWADINAHLVTTAHSLPELVRQLGERRFGHVPRVGDAFCGGGSVPFEAARIGCEAYGSDLNPVAALLTWGALNIVSGGPDVARQVREAQQAVFDAVDAQITAWGIEHNEAGWRADAYLYCTETKCPECGWSVPLAPSWVIGEKTKTIARLVPDHHGKRFAIEILQGVDTDEMAAAKRSGTVRDSRLQCPHCGESTPMAAIRGDRRGGGGPEYGLRLWENEDLVPRPDDVFQERLYCIRWVFPQLHPQMDADDTDEEDRNLRESASSADTNGSVPSADRRGYRAPDEADLAREAKVLALLTERFADWQAKGYIPSRRIEAGHETTRLMRERGWTHWHHLFTPRQLLTIGLFSEHAHRLGPSQSIAAMLMLGLAKAADWNSKLCKWTHAPGSEKTEQTFLNQALNSLLNFGVRGLNAFVDNYSIEIRSSGVTSRSIVDISDARQAPSENDLWLTDPPLYLDSFPRKGENPRLITGRGGGEVVSALRLRACNVDGTLRRPALACTVRAVCVGLRLLWG